MPTASVTPFGTRSCWPERSSAPPPGSQRPSPSTSITRTRNRLSIPLFDAVDRIAGMRWTDAEIPGLLLDLNTAMNEEMDALDALPVPVLCGSPA